MDAGANFYQIHFITSNAGYQWIRDVDLIFSGDVLYHTEFGSVFADMDASDTMTQVITQNGGDAQTDIVGGVSYTNVGGFLVC